jgi:chromate reductase
MISILAISGSLRRASFNTLLLRAAVELTPRNMDISLYENLADLPPFDADLEECLPVSASDLRRRVQRCDGMLIASPEYAHGVSGVMKNALDWLVGGPEFVNKPVALFNASARATHAYAALADSITVMSGNLIEEASATIPLTGKSLDVAAIIADGKTSGLIRSALTAFELAIVQAAAAGATPR